MLSWLRSSVSKAVEKMIWLGDLDYQLTSSGWGVTEELLERKDWQSLLDKNQMKERAGKLESWMEENLKGQ
uniref:Uncharacterized protein n=1 Tax=Leersia perrieri TaxID=77586 RepID=A0A0D9WHT4_9ORYZ